MRLHKKSFMNIFLFSYIIILGMFIAGIIWSYELPVMASGCLLVMYANNIILFIDNHNQELEIDDLREIVSNLNDIIYRPKKEKD